MNKTSYKNIIFDMDGTVLNTLADLCDAVNSFTVFFGFPVATMEQIKQRVGNGIKNLVARSVPGGRDNPLFEKCYEMFRSYYSKNMAVNTRPYDGIISLFDTLSERGIKIAVLSNKANDAAQNLCREYFGDRVSICVGEREGIPRKPAPDGVFYVMEKLDAVPADTLYVGDSEIDIAAAHNGGIKCAAVTWGYREKDILKKAGADFFADDCHELLKIICG